MTEEMVTITKNEYEGLKWDSIVLEFLSAKGVDNWEGYQTPPLPEDYDTEEEWLQAWDAALYGDDSW